VAATALDPAGHAHSYTRRSTSSPPSSRPAGPAGPAASPPHLGGVRLTRPGTCWACGGSRSWAAACAYCGGRREPC
jgi:hypothetical protein